MAKRYFSIFTYFKLLGAIVFMLLSGYNVSAQNKYWMQKAGGGANDEGLSISLDDSNNTYTTGYFSGSATLGTTLLSTLGVTDIFLTKTNSLGVYQWAVKAGEGGADRGLAVKTDTTGNSYITGYYFGRAIFGTDTIKSSGLQDVFVAKYDRNGNLKWVVSAGGTESDIGNAIAIDNAGNVLITGQFTGTATFGTFSLTSTNNNINVFTAKLDSSNGNFLWAKAGTGPHTNRGLGVACDPSGNVYVTGQFTDTITFDNIHNSIMYDAIFLVKYDGSGNEQWFTKAGGGTFNIANSIAVDNKSNIYITGNYTGNLSFFARTITTLTNLYSNKIFIAKYDQNANLLWDVADGSSNPVTSNSISLDGSGNPYIIGNFECIMNGYADKYGQGTFNTVGYWDIFASEYSSANGTWQWSRQIGGHKNNYGYGIAVTPTSGVFTTGSFDKDMWLPWDSNYIGYNLLPWGSWCWNYQSNYHCSDSYYYDYQFFNTTGDLDIFIAKPFYLNRQTYDYYYRHDSTCDRPYIGVCLTDTLCGHKLCPDTLPFCSSYAQIAANPNSYSSYSPGPVYTWQWSNHQTGQFITVSNSGWYSVVQKSEDGCFVSTDSVYVIIHPLPPAPTISDNIVINHDTNSPIPIVICRDSILLTGGNFGSNKHYWTNGGFLLNDTSINRKVFAPTDSVYYFVVVDTFGCIDLTHIIVELDSLLTPIVPALFCPNCKHDTAYMCPFNTEGNYGFYLFTYDTISNPNHYSNRCIQPWENVTIKWSSFPHTITFDTIINCIWDDVSGFAPKDSGWYYLTDSIFRKNKCNGDTNVLKDSIYVRFMAPLKATLKGNISFCPANGEWLIASGGTKYNWGYPFGTKDSAFITKAGTYYVNVSITDRCDTTMSISVNTFPEPTVTMNPLNGLVCPGDSVKLSTSSTDGSIAWQGPSGPIGGNTNFVYVEAPGNYICVQHDTTGCLLVSNTVQVGLYGTPFILATPNQIICPGDTAKLSVIASPGAVIQWQSPFSGSDTVQYATNSGTYTCKVTSCNITTTASVTVSFSDPKAIITAFGPTSLCPTGDTVILTANDSNVVQWMWDPGYLIALTDTITHPGTYSLTTIDGYGCTASASIVITSPTVLRDSSLTHSNVLCNGDNTGIINIVLSGGKPSYTYTWSNGATTPAISGLSAGTYMVSANDKCGSTTTASVIITQPLLLKDSNNIVTNINCFGNNTGIINLNASGGTPAYSYQWSNSATTSAIGALSAGTYSVTITDKNGCTTTTIITLTQPTALAASAILSTNENCNGGSNASASVSITGGSPSYTYLWTPIGQTTPSVSNLSAGSYSVIVTDSAGCSLTSSVSITQPNAISATIITDNATCLDNDGRISATVSGGIVPYSYLWNPGGNSSSVIFGLSSGRYKVIIHDSNGCIDTASGFIGIDKTFTLAVTGADSICKGGTVTLTASGATTYIWSNSSTSSSITVSPTGTITYNVIGTTGVCSDTIPYTVHLIKTLFSNMPASDTICPGKPVILKVNISGGKPVYTYTWSNGITNDNAGPITVYPTSTTTYSVTVTDACNYTTTDTTRVYVVPSGNVSFIVTPDTLQPGQIANFINNSQNITNYLWNFGDGNTSSLGTPTHTYSVAGTYQIILIGENSHGCPDTAIRDVYVSPTINIPNIFTPNGDGINDIFYFNIEGATCLHCHIYNRWGVLVYILNSVAEGWPGIIRQTNEQASDGVYYYILEYCDFKGITHNLDGFIQLMRNKQ